MKIIRVAVIATLALALMGWTAPARAEPATTVSYSGAAAGTRLNGYAFDTCDAPSAATMRAWSASPYDGLGIYLGGVNRTCRQTNLTATWVTTVAAQGWRLIPTYLGHQPPCTLRARSQNFTLASASSVGTADAVDAVARATALGLRSGSAIYADVENYVTTDLACRSSVRRYVSSWTKELHRRGHLAGVYVGLTSGARDLSVVYASTTYARPDAVWVARWDGSSSLSGWANIPADRWANIQRGKQFRGDHDETWGGVTLNVDSDRFDAPVASVAGTYLVTAAALGRSAPSTAAPVVRTYAAGATVGVVCQTYGTTVGTSAVWDRLTDQSFVADVHLSTPSATTYSAALPRCTLPYQVTTTSLNTRTGPGTSYATAGTLPGGALGWVVCQRRGTTVGTTAVWNRLHDGRWVSDAYLATPGTTGRTTAIRSC